MAVILVVGRSGSATSILGVVLLDAGLPLSTTLLITAGCVVLIGVVFDDLGACRGMPLVAAATT
ncbi:hypothetical protein [Nocardia yunnanensis]|uniref:hypothetical protein n=1 Tax=Nocardia yunnanensis TaxID=2382165 RepID=UPI0013C458E5|nr:hypothetical protein [Nocardia yunnanensis]